MQMSLLELQFSGSYGGRRHKQNSLKLDVTGPVAGFGCLSTADELAVVR